MSFFSSPLRTFIKKQGFSKEKIAEECQVNIPEVEEILKEIEDL